MCVLCLCLSVCMSVVVCAHFYDFYVLLCVYMCSCTWLLCAVVRAHACDFSACVSTCVRVYLWMCKYVAVKNTFFLFNAGFLLTENRAQNICAHKSVRGPLWCEAFLSLRKHPSGHSPRISPPFESIWTSERWWTHPSCLKLGSCFSCRGNSFFSCIAVVRETNTSNRSPLCHEFRLNIFWKSLHSLYENRIPPPPPHLWGTLAFPVVVEQGLAVWVHVGVVGLLSAELQVLCPGPNPVCPSFYDGLQSSVQIWTNTWNCLH